MATSGRPKKVITPPPVEIGAPSCFYRMDKRVRLAVERATVLLEQSAVYCTEAVSTPGAIRAYLKLKLAALEHEEFHAIWIDAQNHVIAFDRMFTGTLTQTSVYPREVIKAALKHNASAVVFSHNHPSGPPTPSLEDERLTKGLKAALALVDVKLLDHFIVCGNAMPVSFFERGLL